MEKNTKNLISLKEAAAVSGYSADYIGQLIRSGKIFGKQVYTNIAWMTTAEEVVGYKNKSKTSGKNKGKEGKDFKTFFSRKKRKLILEFNIIKLALGSLKEAWPLLLITIFTFILLISFSIYYFTNSESAIQADKTIDTQEFLQF